MDVGERYVLGRLIGQGATAYVYEAMDSVLEREVAVKVFRDGDIEDSRSVRIDEEARILASLTHPHLLPVYDTGRGADGHRFLVMPLVRGTTLAKLAEAGPVAPREVKRIGKALADALSYIHARGVVHRDVKPSNVLLAADGTPYLADFGFAHADGGPSLTATDCVVGTAGYLAPEQAQGLSVTPAVDVYALGLVLLEALTGERAYSGTPLERATANALRPPGVPARLGAGWLKVLRTLTAKNPSARVTAVEAGTLLDVGEDELPEISALDETMELPSADAWSRPPSGTLVAGPPAVARAEPASMTVGAGRAHRRRRLAAVGAAGLIAAAVAGLGTEWLTAGASADTHSPGSMTPGNGAGAAGPNNAAPPQTATTVPLGNGSSPASPSASTTNTPAAPKVFTAKTSPSAKCQGGGGHGKHKCPGDGGGGDGGGGWGGGGGDH